MKSSVQFSPNKYFENISRMFKKLYNDEQLADVTLCCKDGTIKAHKLILSTCSPYFHRIFTENHRDHPILIMHGVSYQSLHNLIELIYNGNVEVLPESLNSLYELAGEFQLSGISGILRDEGEKSEGSYRNDVGNHGRDTRYRGQKRVAVDYKENEVPPLKRVDSPRACSTPVAESDKGEQEGSFEIESQSHIKQELPKTTDDDEPPKLSAWARKQRKFKCDLCPSSFKRSSHLTRHQLVHTGERPFACDQCDKAFSRHDKLKHHVRKTHEYGLEADFCLEISHDLEERSPSPPPFIISHVRTEAVDEPSFTNPPKRPRGRPRKYPVVEKPLIKRGRGRPRLNPVSKPGENGGNGENYDITNLPYGDLDYLTMPLAMPALQEPITIEPLVEIKTEKEEEPQKKPEESKKDAIVIVNDEDEDPTNPECLRLLENKIAKIGECTISVANH